MIRVKLLRKPAAIGGKNFRTMAKKKNRPAAKSILPEENVPPKVKQLYDMVRAAPEGSNSRYQAIAAMEAYIDHYHEGRPFEEFMNWALRTFKSYDVEKKTKNNAKPIVMMYIPPDSFFHSSGEDSRTILMRQLNGNYGQPLQEAGITYPDYWKDYYWLVFTKDDIDEPELQVFYDKDFTPINFEELKKFIEDSLKTKEDQL
jgi:hypothetical protein